MKLTDALSGVLLMLLGLFMLWQAAQFPSFGGQPYGAALLPSILAAGLILGGTLLVLRDVMARRHADGGAWLHLVPDLRAGGMPALLAVLGNILAQIWLAPWLGFIPVSAAGLLVLFLVLRLRLWAAAALAVGTSFACWWLFAGLLRVPLPRGLLDRVL
ncbi:tripartite tricarboxylate transporter TctB family protein [Paracoccus rhizosphaerae]|uniref:Tripartite tricarboxylate transporter TctB family protein n=1 Tax=Paracoccus rhizosphaerae TaxID=1133347 RepID=A0ABV6CKH4_9RHOB|nr:tripartite tricarboxylate transporter TctB family protein [Paracoccus rhizosphaerae]